MARDMSELVSKVLDLMRFDSGEIALRRDWESVEDLIGAGLEQAKEQFETNFFGAVRMINAALPAMRRQSAGRIVNLSSLVGLTGVPLLSFYSASKFALEGYTESLRYELRDLGISVSLVEPSWVRTGLGEAVQQADRPVPAYDRMREPVLAAIGHRLEAGLGDLLAAGLAFAVGSGVELA